MLDWLLRKIFYPRFSPPVAKPMAWAVYIHQLDWCYGVYRTEPEARGVLSAMPMLCSALPLVPSETTFSPVGWAVLDKRGRVYDTYDTQENAEAVAEANPGMTARALFVPGNQARASK